MSDATTSTRVALSAPIRPPLRVLICTLSALLCACIEEEVTRYSIDFSSCLQLNTTQLSNLDPSCGGDLRDFLSLPAVDPLGCWRFRATGESGEPRVVSMRWENNQFIPTAPITDPLPSPIDMEMWAYDHSYESCEAAISFDPRCELASCFMYITRQGATLNEQRALSFRDQAGRCEVTTGLTRLQGICEIPMMPHDATPPADRDPPDGGAPDEGAPDEGAPDEGPPPPDATPLSECDARRAELGQECTLANQLGECARGRYYCDPEREVIVCRSLTPPLEEKCDGLDNNCDGEIDSPEACAALISDHCELWLAWADDSDDISPNGDEGPPWERWGSCPEQEMPNVSRSRVACVSSGRDRLFHPFAINYNFDSNTRLGLMWRCPEATPPQPAPPAISPGEYATLQWAHAHCKASMYIKPNGQLQDPPVACDQLGFTSGGQEACVYSPQDGFSEIGGQALDWRSYLGLSFSCAPSSPGSNPSLETRGALIQQGVKVELGILKNHTFDALSSDPLIWERCRANAVLDTSYDEFCVESGRDGGRLSGNLRLAGFVSGNWFGVALQPRLP